MPVISSQSLPGFSLLRAGRVFFAASSGVSTSCLSRAEGAAQKMFRRSARQVSIFDVPTVQMELFGKLTNVGFVGLVSSCSASTTATNSHN